MMIRRRRGVPLLALGTGVVAGRAMAKKGMRQQQAAAEEAAAEQEQNARIASLQEQVAGQQAPVPAPAPPAGAPGDGGTVGQLQSLAALRDAGILSAEEFEKAKAKVLG